ncbi:MAG TPA: UDP-3-O-(3-hydroxymyristoyl)glucosamine N-acyltransferase [Planctomycetes bacterium]|nr:UDP-3-O-(3-hydroxymyristoyl)glucosamine N-acyltransferase [Planctomycetota bacterium]
MDVRPFLLSDLARETGSEHHGEDLEIRGAAGIEDARDGDITFLQPRHPLSKLESCRAAAIILSPDHPSWEGPHLRHASPRWVFARALARLHGPLSRSEGIDPSARVHPTARVATTAAIGPFAIVGEKAVIDDGVLLEAGVFVGSRVHIGKDSRLDAYAVIRDDCVIGERVWIYSHAVIGSQGFGFEIHEGRAERLWHVGGVLIEDDVEIGAGSHVDRATTGMTVIGAGTKIDNHVMVGHNCRIGAGCCIAAHTGLAGSCILGDGVVMGGGCGVADHTVIGDGARIAGGSGVHGRVPAGATFAGTPAREHRSWLREMAALSRLPSLLRRRGKTKPSPPQ